MPNAAKSKVLGSMFQNQILTTPMLTMAGQAPGLPTVKFQLVCPAFPVQIALDAICPMLPYVLQIIHAIDESC